MRRDPLGKALFLLILILLGLFAWLSRYPGSPILDRVEEWPVVGRLVGTVRDKYLRRETEVSDEREGEQKKTGKITAEIMAEKDDHLSVRIPQRVWVNDGTEIRSHPKPEAPLVATVPEITKLVNLRRSGDWFLVRYRETEGWVYLEEYGEEGKPPLGSEPAAPKPLPGLPPNPELLRLARSYLAPDHSASALGAYSLFTDSEDEVLHRKLARLADQIEGVYHRRYGIAPIDEPREAIVLFARESGYRAFQHGLERLSGLPAAGLMSRGIMAIHSEGRDSAEIGATLVHELAHALNRRALGPALPPWIDEGIADDLAYSVGDDGELRPGRLGGVVRREDAREIISGGRAAALRVREAIERGQVRSLPRILDFDWTEFVVEDELNLNYPQSAFWIRYLLSGWRPELAEGFRSFLRGIAAGEPVTSEALAVHLGWSWGELDRDFSTWTLLGFPGGAMVGSVVTD